MSDVKHYDSYCAYVGCDAVNCSYNKEGSRCTAEQIKVDGKRAHSTGETCCKTFKPRGEGLI